MTDKLVSDRIREKVKLAKQLSSEHTLTLREETSEERLAKIQEAVDRLNARKLAKQKEAETAEPVDSEKAHLSLAREELEVVDFI